MARLPQPGGDDGNWGSILNDYLSQTHNTDGTLKDDIVGSTQLQDDSVSVAKLDAGTGSTNDVLIKDTTTASGIKWGTPTPSPVSLNGDLSGTSSNAQLNAGVVDNTILADGSVTPEKLNSDTPVAGELLSYDGAAFEWITPPAASGSGEVNTASNVGASGVGVYKQKTGVNFELKKVKAGSTKLTVTDNTGASTIDLDVNEANLNLANISGSLAQSNVTGLSAALSAKIDTSTKGQSNGVASLDGTGKVPSAQLPTTTTADATTTAKGIVQLAGDLGGTAASPTVPGLAAKATDSAVVHNTGTETVAGVKTFSSSPVVPTPSTGTQAANKTYVDTVASSGAPDATTTSKGIVQLAGDLGGTATVPTVPGLAAKAADSAVVHNTGTETVAGVKTFSSSPVVPTPSTGTQAANKTYVDSVASSGAPDATTTTKGIVQLAGDLGGTAASPTVPGLAGKANTTHTHAISDVTSLQTSLNAKADDATTITGANSITGGGDLSANRTLALVNDSASPGSSRYYGTDSGGSKGWFAIAGGGGSVGYQQIFLDDMAGANDDAKLTAAIALQQSTAGMPPIVLGARNHAFNQTRTLYSGLKLIGQSTGPKNLEQNPEFVTSRITLGSSVSSGTSSWWVTPGGNLFDIYMGDFAVQGNAGSSVHQFIDVTSGTLYACEFHSLAFNFMRSVFGRKDRKCLCTQVIFSGHWTANNLWDTQFFIGGSDNQFWMGGMINIGPSASGLQTGTYADGDYEIMFDTLGKTDIGYIYMSALNGWRGIKVTGSGVGMISFFGGTYEGYNGTTSRAPGTVIRLEGGSGAFYGPHIGQAMMTPDAAEGGYVHMTGGEWSFYGPQFYHGSTADSVPAIYQTGGRLYVTGATRGNQSETWSPRPILQTSAAAGNAAGTGSNTTYCPDLSMSVT
jgi:hypothetical protein